MGLGCSKPKTNKQVGPAPASAAKTVESQKPQDVSQVSVSSPEAKEAQMPEPGSCHSSSNPPRQPVPELGACNNSPGLAGNNEDATADATQSPSIPELLEAPAKEDSEQPANADLSRLPQMYAAESSAEVGSPSVSSDAAAKGQEVDLGLDGKEVLSPDLGAAARIAASASPARAGADQIPSHHQTVGCTLDQIGAKDEVSDLDPPKSAAVDQTADLIAAAEAEDWRVAEDILRGSGECDANARTTDWGYSLIRAAAEEGEIEVCRLLVARRADVNARDQNAMTPLMGCVVGGDVGDLVSLLLDARADAKATTDDKFTALKWATRLNREEAITVLRAAGLEGEASCF